MLQRNPSWKRARIFLKAIAADELKEQSLLAELQSLSIEKRLPLNIEVLVTPVHLDDKLNLIKEFSKDAEIVFTSLSPPPKDGESVDEYIKYLHKLSEATKATPSLILVLSSDHTPLEVILK